VLLLVPGKTERIHPEKTQPLVLASEGAFDSVIEKYWLEVAILRCGQPKWQAPSIS
jgi:hypothetical protein